MVVHTSVGVWVLLGPQLTLRCPVTSALLEVTLHQVSQPRGRYQLRSTHLPPVRVHRHGGPLSQLTPRHRPQLVLAVSRYDDAAPYPGTQHPQDQPGHQCALTYPPARANRHPQRLHVQHPLVGLDVVRDVTQHPALPLTRPLELSQRCVLHTPREHEQYEALRVILDLGTPQLRHQRLLFICTIYRLLHYSNTHSTKATRASTTTQRIINLIISLLSSGLHLLHRPSQSHGRQPAPVHPGY